MHKKTLNIAATCLVAILVVFVITQKNGNQDTTSNIEVEGGDSVETAQVKADEYQQQVLQAIIDQNIKTFESVADSFKKKPTDTLSDTITKNTFAEYIDYNTTDSLDVEKITADTVNALKEHPVQKSNVSLQDIALSANTTASLRNYVNQISIIQTELVKSIYSVRNKTDKSIYIKNLYKTASQLYKKLPVPQSVATEHLGIINGYADYALGFELLELQDTDPAKALAGVQTAKEAEDMLIKSFSSIKKIVLLNNITYTKGEPAYVWFIESTGNESIKTN